MMDEKNSLTFKIVGMDCAEETAILKQELGPVVGEENLSFDILSGRMRVAQSGREVSADAIVQAVARTGMRAEPVHAALPTEGPRTFWSAWGRTAMTSASGLCLVLGFVCHAISAGSVTVAFNSDESISAHQIPIAARFLYLLSVISGVWFFLPKAWYAVRRLRPDMNLLMVVAAIGAISIGEWLEAATVAFLFAVSIALESWSVGRARRAVQALMDLAPPVAILWTKDGGEQTVPLADVSIGSVFIVKPGERFPLDGLVVNGKSHVNEAPITGESRPVSKEIGNEVFAGTINGDGVLFVQNSKPATDTTLAQIIRLVGEAQAQRAPSEQWVEKFAKVYTPTVLMFALAILIFPPLLWGGAWSDWFYRSLVLLVIACPCALVISTPVSIVAALTASARNGVLIKGGLYVEAPARLNAVAVDKTGTLTLGKPEVKTIVPLSGHDEDQLLERVAALEVQSTHPLARAIVEFAEARAIRIKPADNYQIIQGKGASGSFKGENFWVGSHRYLEERKQETPEIHEQLEAFSRDGHTVVVVGNDRHVCGFITLADSVRPGIRDTISALRAAGVQYIAMLTGDNRGTADAIARETGVDEVYAELLPADKVRIVETLVTKYGNVAMIGDGVNDAPALARATVGIAMGVVGSDAAIETADIALMSDDLAKLPWLVRHSRHTLAVIRQNILFSLGVKALFMGLVLFGHASLWGAIAADTGASLLVIFNGLRLLRT